MQTIIETDPDLVSAVLVTKDGRLVATDPQISMQTSSDMMNEKMVSGSYQGEGHSSLDAGRKESLSSEKDKWVISITQEVVDASGQNLGVLRLDIGYQSLEAYLDHLQLGKKKALVSSSIRSMNLSTILKKTVYSSSREMQAMQPLYCCQGWLCPKGAELCLPNCYTREWLDLNWSGFSGRSPDASVANALFLYRF